VIRKERVEIVGDPIVLNYIGEKESSDKWYMDVPTTQLRVSQKIWYFEETSSSLQKLVIRDLHGYDQILTSNNYEPNRWKVAKGSYQKVVVTPNTYFPRQVPLTAPVDLRVPKSGGSNNFMAASETGLTASVRDRAASHTSVEDNLKAFHMYEGNRQQNIDAFYSHTAYMFVRFQDYQFRNLDPCQFQVGIYTDGDFAFMDKSADGMMPSMYENQQLPRSYQSKDKLVSFETSEASWSTSDSLARGQNLFNMILLKKTVTESMISELRSQTSYGELGIDMTSFTKWDNSWFMNWKYFINYVPSFKVKYDNYYCNKMVSPFQALDEYNLNDYTIGAQGLSQPGMPDGYRMGIYPPGVSDTTIYFVVTRVPSLFNPSITVMLPVKTFLLDADGNGEVITVNSISYTTPVTDTYPTWGSMSVTRATNPVDFFAKYPKDLQDRMNAMLNVSPGSLPNSPPVSWNCSSYKYKDGFTCDCDCGAPDPDCQVTMKNIFSNLNNYQNVVDNLLATNARFCDVRGNSFFMVSNVMAGPQCNDMIGPGTVDMPFLFGNDTLYNTYGATCPIKKNTQVPHPTSSQKESIRAMDNLELELAFFTIPQRNSWSEGYSLSVTPSTNTMIEPLSDYNIVDDFNRQYTLKSDRGHYVRGYNLVSKSAADCDDTNYDLESYPSFKCIKDMPPTKTLTYDHVVQINNKWATYPKSDDDKSVLPEPEWTMHFRHDYIFQHDYLVEEVDRQFNSLNVDASQDSSVGTYYKYDYGRRFLFGKYTGTAVDDNMHNADAKKRDLGYFAASNPLLETTLTFELSSFAEEDAENAKYTFNPLYGTWKKLKLGSMQKHLESKWNDLVINFDMKPLSQTYNNVISLKPGYKYNLQAEIQISAIYNKGMFNQEDLDHFEFKIVSTSVSKQPVTPELGNRAIVEYTINFSKGARIFNTKTYNVLTFLSDVGGALGFMAIGGFFVACAQMIYKPPTVLSRLLQEDRERQQKGGCCGIGKKVNKNLELVDQNQVIPNNRD
jgi:hypothetical protein